MYFSNGELLCCSSCIIKFFFLLFYVSYCETTGYFFQFVLGYLPYQQLL